jgi:DNA methylase
MVAAGWSEAQKRAYVLADNKLALNAGWDNDLLKIEIGDLQAFDFDLGLIGFSADEIAGLTFDRSGLTDPDETPETTGNTGERPIENNSSPGQAVYDPFVGSGTTIIAAEMTGRACHAIELSPAYVDVAVTRWQNFTGQTAMLESTGETFESKGVSA